MMGHKLQVRIEILNKLVIMKLTLSSYQIPTVGYGPMTNFE